MDKRWTDSLGHKFLEGVAAAADRQALRERENLPAGFEAYEKCVECPLDGVGKCDPDRTCHERCVVFALRKERDALRECAPVVDKQGVRFGNAWVSFDRLCGWDGEDGPERDAWYAKSIVAKGIIEWANKQHAALAASEGRGGEK